MCDLLLHACYYSASQEKFSKFCSFQVLQHAMAQKNPKIQTESINWLSQALRDFGIAGLNVKLVIDKVKLAIQANNPVQVLVLYIDM